MLTFLAHLFPPIQFMHNRKNATNYAQQKFICKLFPHFFKSNQKSEPIQSFLNSIEQYLTRFVAGFRPEPHRLVCSIQGSSGYCEYAPQVLDKESRSPANQLLARFPSIACPPGSPSQDSG